MVRPLPVPALGRPEGLAARPPGLSGNVARGREKAVTGRLGRFAHEGSPSGAVISRSLAAIAGQAGLTRRSLLA
jgi:hypothetical protein